MGAVLEFDGVTKAFPGVVALDGVSFSVEAGTTHALMGENGAGKSTLMKCLFGVYSRDGGRILIDGKEVGFKSSKEALAHGVAMVHQELNQASKLTVAENMWLGRMPKLHRSLPFVNTSRMIRDTKRIFDELSLDIDPRAVVETLPVSQRQMIEIARAVSYGARVIAFDEPTSSLNSTEAEKLFAIIDRLKRDGCAIIYISHKMEEILRISDTVTVMRDGRHVATEAASDMTTDKIIRLMVGRELTARYPERQLQPGEPLLEVRGLTAEYSQLQDVSFTLRAGEILGVAGLDGSGRTELLENIFGTATRRSGELYLRGERINNTTPEEAIKNGFAFVTEERRATGIFGILSVRENTVIGSLKNFLRGPFLSSKKMQSVTREYIDKLGIKTPSDKTGIRTLSGGNQQKVIFSRWMLTSPTVLLLDEPTRGIDVGAKFEIYQLTVKLAEEGRGVILVSSEMPELLGLCDRILVMSAGRLAGIAERGAGEEDIMRLATKHL